MKNDLFEEVKNNLIDNKSNHLTIMHDTIVKFKLKTIVECGVDRGTSTCAFLEAIKKTLGRLYSFDIKDCSKLFTDENWNFFQVNDTNIKKILQKYPDLEKNGIDFLYIDSYHEPNHVRRLLYKYFPYININGYIFIDDTSAYPFRNLNILTDSINSDLCKEEVEEFYFSNFDILDYQFNGGENGLAILKKNKNKDLNINYLYKYNFLIYQFFKFIKKIKYKFFYKS